MNEIIRQIPLYRFLKYCNETDMERIYEGEKKDKDMWIIF